MLKLENISFSYKEHPAVNQISVAVSSGEHLAIIGESGSGKSTLLKLIFGIHDLDSGVLTYKEDPILGPKHQLLPGDSRFKYLAQDFGLMPFITAAENVGAFLSNIDGKKKKHRIAELLELVGMENFADVMPKNLSGGQQQRIAIAKALASEPELILLDEPFSQIDSHRARDLKRNLFLYFKENSISCLVATHHGEDALAFADSVLVMKNGKSVAYGKPKELYQNPPELYVASLFAEAQEIELKHFKGDLQGRGIFYTHQLRIASQGLRVSVLQSYFQGDHYLIQAKYADGVVFFRNPVPIMKGQGIFLDFHS